MDLKKRLSSPKKYTCPRCGWLLESILSKYVTKEGDFEFLHCMNCGQDYYMEFRELLETAKDEIEDMMLKRIDYELKSIIKPVKYWNKRKKASKSHLN